MRYVTYPPPSESKDAAVGRWLKGVATTLPEFGSDPTATTDYAFCVL